MGAPLTRIARRETDRAAGPSLLAAALAAMLIPVPAQAQLRGSLAEEAPRALFSEPGYRVKPVEGAPAAVGVRRVIERFSGWTLICDEEKRRRVCNASQSIVDADGGLAFSWSLAATKGGEPVFLVRAPVTGFPARTVTLAFGPDETVIRLDACDVRLCLGFLPLSPGLVKRIKERGAVGIRYRMREGDAPVFLTASLDGLGTAIGSIR